ncbi:hypothetical protein J4474_03815 [Candidatus Pacearchaeota archaeon]|nr:hypothetical protein [Candidatus Pacearchaeota archaeon]
MTNTENKQEKLINGAFFGLGLLVIPATFLLMPVFYSITNYISSRDIKIRGRLEISESQESFTQDNERVTGPCNLCEIYDYPFNQFCIANCSGDKICGEYSI